MQEVKILLEFKRARQVLSLLVSPVRAVSFGTEGVEMGSGDPLKTVATRLCVFQSAHLD